LNILAGLFTIYIVSWNAPNLGIPQFAMPNSLSSIGYLLHLDQSWEMFSPKPPNILWYYVIEGELDNGQKVELWRHGGLLHWQSVEMTWAKPDVLWPSFKNHRWFKYYENGINSHTFNDLLRLNWGRYICREYNSRHIGKEALFKFLIHWVPEQVNPDKPKEREERTKQIIWNHICYERRLSQI